MDDSDFCGVYINGDIGMISNNIHELEKTYPSEFCTCVYFIYPAIIYSLEIFFVNRISLYMNTNHLSHIQNEMFITIGLNIISLITLILIICGIFSIYELSVNGVKFDG